MRLLTEEVRKSLPRLYANESKPAGEALAVVKFFCPWSNWTWWATEFDGEDLFFGLVEGFEKELGYFSLSELEGIAGPGGLAIERDVHFSPAPLKKIAPDLFC